MAQEPNPVEQVVSRAVRDNLDRLQRTVEELDQAFADLVSACSSSRPTNVLPPMLRAQTAAASLAASLEVLARFITNSLHVPRSAAEEAVMQAVSVALPAPPAAPTPVMPPPSVPTPMAAEAPPASRVAVAPPPPAQEPVVEAPPPPPPPLPEVVPPPPPPAAVIEETVEMPIVPPAPPEPVVEAARAFDVAKLSPDEQKMHERANRHAKVSMQDIKLYKKQEVRLGIENQDLCIRLREDIDKAKKEYDRRFRSILDHPVDYFYKWMVEILAEGNPEALGKYPYPSPVHRR